MEKSLNEMQREYLGYNKFGKINYKILDQLLKSNIFNGLDTNKENESINNSKVMTLDEIKKVTIKFYTKYFDIHDIQFLLFSDLKKEQENISSSDNVLEAYKKYSELCKEISPFDLPITLVPGSSMQGEAKKSLSVTEKPKNITNKTVPFSFISLGNKLTEISSATYTHEIAHTQTESIIGYAEDYLNKEVISIFLEKLAILEIDPTGQLLKKQERRRFSDIYDRIRWIGLSRFSPTEISEEELKDSYMYIHSTLIAEKLFDNYISERKAKKKDKYIYGIQDIFDGKTTVEEYMKKQDVDISKAANPNMLKKHL